MRKALGIAACTAILAVLIVPVSGQANARAHRYWYAAYSEYDYGNTLSPCSYIYPSADWGPFFHHVRHYGPVVHLRPYGPCYTYY
jgi:hypothetical protein